MIMEKLTYDTWLLTIIKKVTKELNIRNGINYKGDKFEFVKQYFGRVIIKYRKDIALKEYMLKVI